MNNELKEVIMKKELISEKAPKAIGPYSQAIETDNLIFLSGQIGFNEKGELAEGGTVKEFEQIMKNIGCVLEEVGLDFSDIVKTTIFLKNMGDFQQVNSAYEKYFSKPYPARSTVEVSKLPKGVNIEIEVIAVKNS